MKLMGIRFDLSVSGSAMVAHIKELFRKKYLARLEIVQPDEVDEGEIKDEMFVAKNRKKKEW